MMVMSSIKIVLVVYIMIALGCLLWQAHAGEILAQCEFNAGACATALKDFTSIALVWPSQLFVLRTI